MKPKPCRASAKRCEECRRWEPIPYHDDGGVCLAGNNPPSRRLRKTHASKRSSTDRAKGLAAAAPGR